MSTIAEPRPTEFSIWNRLRGWLRNPWGRPRFLVIVTWLYVLWSIVPVLIAVQFSFNATRSRTVATSADPGSTDASRRPSTAWRKHMPDSSLSGGDMALVAVVLVISLAALGFAAYLVKAVLAADQGTVKMREIAQALSERVGFLLLQ